MVALDSPSICSLISSISIARTITGAYLLLAPHRKSWPKVPTSNADSQQLTQLLHNITAIRASNRIRSTLHLLKDQAVKKGEAIKTPIIMHQSEGLLLRVQMQQLSLTKEETLDAIWTTTLLSVPSTTMHFTGPRHAASISHHCRILIWARTMHPLLWAKMMPTQPGWPRIGIVCMHSPTRHRHWPRMQFSHKHKSSVEVEQIALQRQVPLRRRITQ